MIVADLGSLGKLTGSDALGGASGLMSLAGGILGAQGAQQAGAAQAQAYGMNAAAAGTTAANARLSAARQTQQLTYRRNELIGSQRAGYAAGGVSPDGGTPLDVLGDSEDQVRQQALNLFYGGDMAGRSAGDQVAGDLMAAKAAREAADTSSTASILGGIGGLAKAAFSMFAL